MNASRVVRLGVKLREEPLPCVSVVVSGDFCRFKLALPSLLSTSCFDMDNSDGKESLKRQKSPETMTDTQGMSKFY